MLVDQRVPQTSRPSFFRTMKKYREITRAEGKNSQGVSLPLQSTTEVSDLREFLNDAKLLGCPKLLKVEVNIFQLAVVKLMYLTNLVVETPQSLGKISFNLTTCAFFSQMGEHPRTLGK